MLAPGLLPTQSEILLHTNLTQMNAIRVLLSFFTNLDPDSIYLKANYGTI